MKTDLSLIARNAAIVACSLFVAACVTADDVPMVDHGAAAASAAALGDAPARMRADVEYLADDAMEGREAGTRGYDAAADYVAARMAGLDLTPGVNGGWFQDVGLRTSSSTPEASTLSVTNSTGETTALTFLEDFKIFPSLEKETISFDAPAVFVGYGIHAPEIGHDDFDGLDVRGKVIVRFGGAPASFDSEARAHFGLGASKAKYIADEGALGVIGIYSDTAEERFPWSRAMRNPIARSITWIHPDGAAAVSGSGLNGSISLNPDITDLMFDGAPRTYRDIRAQEAEKETAPKGFDLPVTVSMSGASTFEDVISANVVGVIEGADPALKNEALVITAHLDHVGIDQQAGANEDNINNGAMDNAMGVAMMLETARRFQEGPPPARTVVFLALTAEEKGLLGAGFFAQYPSIGDKEIIANVNLDMPLMLHSFTDIVAFGGERSSLGPLAAEALAEIGVTVSPDPIPEQGVFTRSDHYRFVEQGIPSIFLWPGFANGGEEVINDFLAKHYHNVSDDMSLPIRWDDAVRFTDVNYKIAREIADRPERPTWNEGDFFGELFAGE